jgi:hypothetical protein
VTTAESVAEQSFFDLMRAGLDHFDVVEAAVARPAGTGERREADIRSLRHALEQREAVSPEPEEYVVRGVFYPAVLLSSGVWERDEVDAHAIDWPHELQRWLFSGFIKWAPSLDLNTTSSAGRERPFLGQIGYEDEAFSLLVVVTGEGAAETRERLLGEDEMACNVELAGTLMHSSHANPEIDVGSQPWGKTFEYCLRVELGRDGHHLKRTDEQEEYSGYLWECVAPRARLRVGAAPAVRDVFFLWEHTDLSSTAAREYAVASLQHKRAYVEKLAGELVLVQKSSPKLPGEPLMDADEFFAIVAERSGG